MARAEANWERLVRAALRGERLVGAYGQPVTGIAGNVPSSLGNNVQIEEVLRAADEIQDEDPTVARILCEHAYTLAQSLDPNSEGRGVLQFKTGLMSVIRQKLAKREGVAIDRSEDIAKLQEFYKLYREKHKVDELIEDESKLRESAVFSGNLGELERKTRKRKKVLATLKVLWSVIEDMTKDISPEDAKNLISEEEKLVIIGPEWPINPLGPLGLQIFRSIDGGRKRKRTAIQRIPILRSWNVPECDDGEYDDDKPAVHHQSFDGETPDEKVNIRYMIIPNTTEARCQIFLLLRDCDAGHDLRPRSRGNDYSVSGSVKVSCKQTESLCVDLFSKERNDFKVPCRKKTQVPMHSLVCLPDEELDMIVHFTLKPSVGKKEEIGPFVVNFNPTVKTRIHNCDGHTVEIAVNMSK